VLIGLALAMIASARGAWGREQAFAAFVVQLLLNLAWSPLFFAAHQITYALVLLGVLIAATLVTMLLFWRVRPLAAWLMLPYLAWLLFAALLNWQFLKANQWADGQERSGASQRIEL
jgi:translocator protein